MTSTVTARPDSANQVGALRYLLAFSIVVHHVNSLSGSQWYVLVDPHTVVSFFFLLGGYFGWKSWLRRPHFREFVVHRLRRLLPAYWAVVLVGAVGLVSVSNLSVEAYFTSPQWWRYLAANFCLLNFLEPNLPGVFSHHLYTAVNPALWYVKVEVCFTLLLPLWAKLWKWLKGKEKSCVRNLWARVILWSFGLFLVSIQLLAEAQVLKVPVVGLRYLVYLQMNLWGIALYSLFPRIRLQGMVSFCWVIPFLLLVLMFCVYYPPFARSVGALVALAVVFRLFLFDGPLRGLNRSNLSYGIYLCHSPLIQLALVWAFPAWGVVLMACISLPLAYGIHRWVERRCAKS